VQTEGKIPMKSGRTLRAIRLFHRQSLGEAATNLQCAKSFISDLENDKRTPSLDTLGRYAAVYDIPVSSIMLLIESETRKPTSLRDTIKVAVTKKLLGVLEIMAPKERDA
jgi:transcriptional regulator with XRE-family HTH domain